MALRASILRIDAILGVGCGLALLSPGISAKPVLTRAEPQARIVLAPFGGTLQALLVKQGDLVVTGQKLIRFVGTELDQRLDRIHSALNRRSPQTVTAAANLVARIEPRIWHQLMVTDPQLLAAEQEYVTANESGDSLRIKRAVAKRQEAQHRVAQIRAEHFSGFGTNYMKLSADLKWLARQREEREVRAPCDGRLEIFDLHPGDNVLPFGRVALVACTSRPTEVQ